MCVPLLWASAGWEQPRVKPAIRELFDSQVRTGGVRLAVQGVSYSWHLSHRARGKKCFHLKQARMGTKKEPPESGRRITLQYAYSEHTSATKEEDDDDEADAGEGGKWWGAGIPLGWY